MRSFSLLGFFLALCAILPLSARAFVLGSSPGSVASDRFSFRVFGSSLSTGNALMAFTPKVQNVNSTLLSSSTASIGGFPSDGSVVAAFLWWTGSTNNRPEFGPLGVDTTADFTLPDGTFINNLSADNCKTVDSFEGSFYCRKDIKSLITGHTINGTYTVGDVIAEPGVFTNPQNPSGNDCQNSCQAKFGAWSMVIVFESPTQTSQRDVILFDGFMAFDENTNGSGIAPPFTMSGFEVGPPGLADFTFFALEGDPQLGVPPQDVPGNLQCLSCTDFMSLSTATSGGNIQLFDPLNPVGNLYNSSLSGLGRGVDLDRFNVGAGGLNILHVGDTSTTIIAGTGDGDPQSGANGGGGEFVVLGWTNLTLTRPSPRFIAPNTSKAVDFTSAGPGSTLTYTLKFTNEGDKSATNTIVRDTIPAGTTYVPNSTRVNGTPVADVGGNSPLASAGGLNLGTLNPVTQGGTTQVVTFQVSINANATGNITNKANISSTEITTPVDTNSVTTTITAVTIGIPEKRFDDLTAPIGELRPGDLISYTVTVKGSAQTPVSGLQFTDDMPPFLRLVSVFPPAGATNGSVLNGGANGTGQVNITGISLPQGGSANIGITAQVFSEAEFNAAGVASDQIDGKVISNQGKVQGAFLPANPVCTGDQSSSPQCTDDPTTGVIPDATKFTLVFKPDLSTSTKLVTDQNGGILEPGDTLQYTLHLVNTGNLAANVTITDEMPQGVDGATFTAVTVPAGTTLNFTAPPAGTNSNGRFVATGLSIPPGQSRDIVFTIKIANNAANNTAVTNSALVEIANFANRNVTITSQTLTIVSAPILNTTKSVVDQNGGNTRPGDTLAYTITIPNTGNRDATNVVVTDVIDADATLNVASISNGGTFDAATRTITWNIGTIAKNATVTLTYNLQVNAGLADGTTISNQAKVNSTELGNVLSDDPSTPAAGDPTVRVITSSPNFDDATKTVVDQNGGAVEPDDTLSYTISASNQGDTSATGVVVLDVVDINLTAVTPQDGGTFNAGNRTITWNIPGTIAVGQTITVHFTAKVVTPLANNTQICNQASVDSTQTAPVNSDDPTSAAPDDATCVTVASSPELVFTKAFKDQTGGETIPGDPIEYTITVDNTGDAPATNVVITDVIDPNIVNVVPQNGGVFNAATRTITWTIAAPVLPGTPLIVRFTASFKFPLADGTLVCNQSTLATTEIPSTLSDDPATAAVPNDSTCVTVISAPDLGTSIKAFADENAGDPRPTDTILYTITVKNTGTEDAANITIADPLDPNITFIAGSASDGGVFNAATNTVNWSLATLAAGAQKAVTFRVTINIPLDNGLEIANQATVDADRISPILTDDAATPPPPNDDDPTIFAVVSSPDFEDSTKTVEDLNGGLHLPGDSIRYTITVKNTGDMIGRRVTVLDPVDTVNLENIVPGQGGSLVGNQIIWDFNSTAALSNVGLSPAGDVVLTFDARIKNNVTDGTAISNQATISHEDPAAQSDTDDPGTPEDDDPTIITVGVPNFEEFTKEFSVQGGGAAEPLKTVEYTLTVRNTGTASATNVVITDPIDTARLDQITPAQGGLVIGNQIRWDATTTPALAVLEADEEVVLTFTARVRAGTPDGTAISNQATLAFAELPDLEPSDDPATTDNDDPTIFLVSALPDFEDFTKTVTKDLGAPPFAPGDAITYTLTLVNNGDGFGRNVVVTDVVAAELQNVTPGQGGIFNAATRTVRWDGTTTPELGSVDVGATITLTISATISSPLANETEITNQANVADDFITTPEPSDDPDTIATDDPTIFEVLSAPRFTSSPKTAEDLNGGFVQPGDTIRYTINVTNSGTQIAAGVTLTDAVPGSTTYVSNSTTVNGAPVPDIAGGSPLSAGILVASPGQTPGNVLVGDGNAAIVTFDVIVDDGTIEGTLVSNQGTIAANTVAPALTDDPDVAGDSDPTQLVVGQAPNLSDAAKSFVLTVDNDGDGRADIGDVVEFTISVTNRGSDVATNVEITDAIPTDNALFVPGTLTLNGAPLSEVADADAGEVLNNNLTVRVGTLAIQDTATVTFEVTVVAGPAIINQGSVDSLQTAAELTDSDGDDQNGDQETVVPVGDVDQVIVLVDKQAIDQNGGDLATGDVLTYRITVQNVGTLDGVILSVTDELPVGVTFEDFTLTPDGATTSFTPPPAGSGQGIAQVSTIAIDAGDQAIIEFTVTVDGELGDEICNVASVEVAANTEPVESEPACVIVGATPGTGGFAGRIFQDIGVDNQVFDENVDRILPGFEARAFLASDPNGDPVSAAIADANGDYLLLDLPPGDYRIKVFSEEGVFFADAGDKTALDGQTTDSDLVVDPAGTVYEAETGRAIPGARVFLFFDDSDPIDPGAQVPDNDLGENQQGQRTGRLGLYTFDAQAGRRYRIEVRTPSPTLLFPSSLIAKQDGFATLVEEVENEVSVDDIPNVEDDDAEVYFLQFALGNGGDQIANIKNNHLPIDPLRSVLKLNKKTFDAVARVGETVTYQVTVENKGAQAIIPDAQGNNGLAIQDALPSGFRLLQDSVRLERASGGIRVREEIPASETTGRIVSFGGLTINPGESLILTYQTGIRLDVAPGVYENTAQGFIGVSPATDPDSAKVRVELDPDFAESVVIGKVYCDENKNGQQDNTDVGIPYARVYFDTGTYVETDAFGKYHATGFNPGMHLAKIDTNTLPPPGKLTTDGSVLFHATSGLLEKVNFGAVCSYEVAGIDRIVSYANGAGAESMPAVELAEAPANTMVISGDVDDPSLLVDNLAISLPNPIVSLGEGIISVPAANRFFSLSAKTTAEGASSWRLRIWAEGTGEILVDKAGDGAPPSEVPLELATIPEGIYRAQLLATSGDAIVGSPVVTMAVTAGESARDVFSIAQTKTGLFSTKTQAPSKTLATALQKSVTAPGANEVLKVEVYVDGSLTGKKALDTTQKRADAIKKQIAKNLSIPEADIWAVGMGSVSKKVQAKDRKVIVRAVPKAPGIASADIAKAFEAAPFAYAGTEPVPVMGDGSYARALDKTKQDELVVDVGGLDGRRITALIVIREKPPVDLPEGAEVVGDLASREVKINGKAQDLSLLGLDLKVNNKGTLKTVKKVTALAKPLTFTTTVPAGDVARWKIRIVDEAGFDLTALAGEGTPAATLSWDGKDEAGKLLVKAGTSYYAILNLESSAGAIAESMPRRIDIIGKTIKYPSLTYKVNGFDAVDRPTKTFKTKLNTTAKQLVKQADQFYLIRVEVPMAQNDISAKVKAISRANAVKETLVLAGVPAASLRVAGSGSAKFTDKLTKSKLATLNLVSIQRISAVEADALRSRVTVDGEELDLSGTSFTTRFSGDGGLLDLRDATGARLIWTVAEERPRPEPPITNADETLLLSPDWNNAPTSTSLPTLIQDGTMSPTFIDPFGPTPKVPATSQPISKDGTMNPFVEPTSKPSSALPIFLEGAGGDLPPPKRRGDKPKAEDKAGSPGDLPPPKRRGDKPKEEEKPKELPGPKRHGEKTTTPKATTPKSTTPVAKTTPKSSTPVTVTSASPVVAPIALPMPAIGAPVAALPAGTSASQPSEKPQAPDYAAFGKDELDTSAKLAARDAALRAKGIDPATYVERKEEAVEASNVTVMLPKEGVTLRGNRLVIQGDTDPKNKILINGQAVPVDENGHFLAKIDLNPGDSELLLTATDKAGNVAEVKRPIRVDPATYFVLALADVAMGDVEAQNADEESVHNSAQVGPLFMQGRAALYFKGHVKGKVLFDAYDITAHIDTARKNDFEAFIDNVIDPDKYYPIYGDASLEVKEAQARGPIYVMIDADESKMKIGNLQTNLQGVELFRYERTMYGVEVDFKKPTDKDKTMSSEVKIFASTDDRSLHRVHNVFRGTGGSVYTLSADELLEGGEKVRVVVRDPVSGISLTEIPMERYVDYTVDYRSGRVTLRNPLPSSVDSGFLIDHPGAGAAPLAGAPAFLEVDFESEANDFTGSRAGGAYARQSFLKNKISIGGGFVQETRADAAAYQLFGADIQAKWAEKTFLKAEYASSAAQDALTFASPDGGLTFATVGLDDPEAAKGSAFKISGSFELSDFSKKKDKDGKPVDTLGAAAYFQAVDPGFSANGSLFDQGYNKAGISARWKISPDAKVVARVDSTAFSKTVDTENGPVSDNYTNTIASLGFTKKYTKNTVLAELAYLYSDDGLNEDGAQGDPLKRTALSGGVERKLNERWTLLLSQEAVVAASGSSDLLAPQPPGLSTSPLGNALGQTADGRFIDGEISSTGERLTTTVGARYKLSDDISLTMLESLRWDGSNATSFSLRTKLNESMSAYATERFQTQEGEMISSTIVGAEQKLGVNGRTYGEYQLDSAASGETQRAVMGIGKKWKLKSGLAVSGAYEHSQIFGSTTAGSLSRDAVAGGAEWLIKKNLKASGKLELRYDNGDSAEGGVDRVQSLASAAMTYRLTPDWTLFARALNDATQNVTTDNVEVYNRVATMGFAYRPELSDKFNMLGKFSLLSKQTATDLTTNRFDQTSLVAFSLAPVYELNSRYGLAGKLVVRSENRAFEDLTPQQITTLMVAARLNVHFSAQWDLGIELLARSQSGALNANQSGLLLEAAYRISKYVRLGAGYNFAAFTDDELSLDNESAGGFFIRATGQY